MCVITCLTRRFMQLSPNAGESCEWAEVRDLSIVTRMEYVNASLIDRHKSNLQIGPRLCVENSRNICTT